MSFAPESRMQPDMNGQREPDFDMEPTAGVQNVSEGLRPIEPPTEVDPSTSEQSRFSLVRSPLQVPPRIAGSMSGLGSRFSSGARSAYSFVSSRSGLTMLLVVIIGVGVFAALAYTIYRIMSTNLKVSTLLEEAVNARTQSKTISSEKLPSFKNGKEYSLSFWVYVDPQNNTNTQTLKRVISIGDATNQSPMVVMDRTSNKMYFGLRTMQTPQDAVTQEVLKRFSERTDSGATFDYNGIIIMEIEYVPLGRWVNVIIVVDNEVVTMYIDGDIYSVATVTHFVQGGVLADPVGSLNVGARVNGMAGYIANVQVANYAYSVFHARATYNAGPVRRTLSWLLPNNLKLQWPITTTKVDEDKKET